MNLFPQMGHPSLLLCPESLVAHAFLYSETTVTMKGPSAKTKTRSPLPTWSGHRRENTLAVVKGINCEIVRRVASLRGETNAIDDEKE